MAKNNMRQAAVRLAGRYRLGAAAAGIGRGGRPLRWLARGLAGRGKILRRSLGVKRWGARTRMAALRERARLIDQLCVLGAMYPGDGASRASAAVGAASPRTPMTPALLKPEVFRSNNTIAAQGAQPYRPARPVGPGHWSAPPQWSCGVPVACAIEDDVLPVDSASAASAVGSLFSEANEVELAFLMRLIAEGDTATASRIARRIVDAKQAVAHATERTAQEALPQPRPRRARAAAAAEPERGHGSLSPRELKVLRMISQGQSNREIAEGSCRSLHTVDAQVKNIYRKLAVKTRAQAVREAMQQGLLSPEACSEAGS